MCLLEVLIDSGGWEVIGGIVSVALAMADEEEGEEDGVGCSERERFAEVLEDCGGDVRAIFCGGECWVVLLLSSCNVSAAVVLVDVGVLCFPVFLGGVFACSSFKGWFVCSPL